MEGSRIFSLEMDGVAVVPAVRMTRGELYGKRTSSAKRKRIDSYLACKEELKLRFQLEARKRKLDTPLNHPVSLSLEAHYTDKRTRDLKNIVATVEDALVAAGILTDDSVKYLPAYGGMVAKLGQEKHYLRVELGLHPKATLKSP